jgi:hypothetical protein
VEGKKLGQGETRQVKLQSKGGAVIFGTFSLETIKCNKVVSESMIIEGRGNQQGQGKGLINFSSCQANMGGCPLFPESIVTHQLKTHLVINNQNKQTKYAELFEPTQGTTLYEVHFTSPCPPTSIPVTGSMAAEILPIETETKEMLLNFPSEPITKVTEEQQEITVGAFAKGKVVKAQMGLIQTSSSAFGVYGE